MRNGLFREEALIAEQEKHVGTLLKKQLSWTASAALASATVALLGLSAMYFGSYTRKETVAGFLVPASGLMRVVSPESGVVTSVGRTVGVPVDEGQALFLLFVGRRPDTSGPSVEQYSVSKMRNKLLTHENDDATEAEDVRREKHSLKVRQRSIQQSIQETVQQLDLQLARVESAEANLRRYQELATKGFVSEPQVLEKRDALLQIQNQLADIKRTKLELERDYGDTSRSLNGLQRRLRLSQLATERARLDLEQQIAEKESQANLSIAAPAAGTIGGIYVQAGQWAQTGTLLATIIPNNSPLVAQLLVPSRAIGFVQQGQEVRLKLQAFPFERFGTLQGKITSIDANVVLDQDISLPVKPSEPVFRVTVDFDQREYSVRTNSNLPFRAGMLLQGDILVEERRIYEWLFRPVLIAAKNSTL
jgi:membrane fusion protein